MPSERSLDAFGLAFGKRAWPSRGVADQKKRTSLRGRSGQRSSQLSDLDDDLRDRGRIVHGHLICMELPLLLAVPSWHVVGLALGLLVFDENALHLARVCLLDDGAFPAGCDPHDRGRPQSQQW